MTTHPIDTWHRLVASQDSGAWTTCLPMRRATRAACLAGLFPALTLWAAPAIAIDMTALWDFSRPEVSEQRFKAALENATGDDAVILRTQIARTYGLRKDFDTARRLFTLICVLHIKG